MNQRARPEPGLGRIDDLDTDSHTRPGHGQRPGAARAHSRRRRGGLWWLLLLLIVAAGAAIYMQRDLLRAYFPASQTRELLNAAARAEADGRWQAANDGDDALTLYRRILGEDPDNDAARLGLRRVGEQLGVAAEAAIDAGDESAADRLIVTLAEIGVPGDRVSTLRARLEARRASGQELAALLTRAESALARRLIRGRAGALDAYGQMLVLDPGNAVALRGIENALSILAEEGVQAAAEGRIEAAQSLALAVAELRPQHVGLPSLRQAIARAQGEAERQAQAAEREQAQNEAAAAQAAIDAQVERERQMRELDALLARADRHLAAGELEPALESYLAARKRAPEHAQTREGLATIAQASVQQARQAVAGSDPTRAEASVRLARRAGADARELARVESNLADLNERLAAVLARPQLSVQEQARLDALMARAVAADERGDLVEPVGASAYDLYRQVLAIDPMHEEARRAAGALPRRAQDLIMLRIELGQLDEAGHALDALHAMAPRNPALPDLRRQLTDAWLDRGRRSARTGSPDQARQALDRARSLMPAHPGISSLMRELGG